MAIPGCRATSLVDAHTDFLNSIILLVTSHLELAKQGDRVTSSNWRNNPVNSWSVKWKIGWD